MALNKQQVFNKVALHLLKQNERSETKYPTRQKPICAYRGQNGTACAVGCLIPDEMYRPEMEGKLVYTLMGDHVSTRTLFDEEVIDSSLLSAMQNIHDNTSVDNWFFNLVEFAKVHELSAAVIFEKDTV